MGTPFIHSFIHSSVSLSTARYVQSQRERDESHDTAFAQLSLSKHVLRSVLALSSFGLFLLRCFRSGYLRGSARYRRFFLCRWRTGGPRGVLRLLLWRFPLLFPYFFFVCLFLSFSVFEPTVLAAVDLGGLRVTGTQRQVELETIFLPLFLYVIAYLILKVR